MIPRPLRKRERGRRLELVASKLYHAPSCRYAPNRRAVVATRQQVRRWWLLGLVCEKCLGGLEEARRPGSEFRPTGDEEVNVRRDGKTM